MTLKSVSTGNEISPGHLAETGTYYVYNEQA